MAREPSGTGEVSFKQGERSQREQGGEDGWAEVRQRWERAQHSGEKRRASTYTCKKGEAWGSPTYECMGKSQIMRKDSFP